MDELTGEQKIRVLRPMSIAICNTKNVVEEAEDCIVRKHFKVRAQPALDRRAAPAASQIEATRYPVPQLSGMKRQVKGLALNELNHRQRLKDKNRIQFMCRILK